MISIDDIWKRILENEGELLKTKRGKVFSYKIKNETIITQWHHQDQNRINVVIAEGYHLRKHHIEKSLERMPMEKVTDLRDIFLYPSHLWGILNDVRIIPELKNIRVYRHSIFQKEIRWNAKTRDYETLYLNDSNQTKEEYEEFRKDFFKEHDHYPEDE